MFWVRSLVASLALLCALPFYAQTFTRISTIMTNLPNSPELGKTRTIRGVVNAVFTNGTVYVVSLESDKVGGGAVESVPVVGAIAPCATIGSLVNVTGVVKKQPSQTAAGTEAVVLDAQACSVTGIGTSKSVYGRTPLFTTYTDGMQFTGSTFNDFYTADVSPTTGKWDDATATMTHQSIWWGLPSEVATRVLRKPGIQPEEYVPASAPATVLRSTGYPNLTIQDGDLGGSLLPTSYSTGALLICSFTPAGLAQRPDDDMTLMDWTTGRRRLVFLPESQCLPSNPGFTVPTVYAHLRSGSIGVSTLDLFRFYDDRSDAAGVPVVTTAGYQRRLTKAAMAGVDVFDLPHVFAVQEVKSTAALNDLGLKIASYAATKGKRAVSYRAYVFDGNTADHLNNGFLVDEAAVQTVSAQQVEKSSTYSTTTGGSALLWERPPVVLRLSIPRSRVNYLVTVINVHLSARDGIDDPASGAEVRQHRKAQAEDLAALVQAHQAAGERVMVVGNFNAYQFNDGFVDVVGTVAGAPAAATNVTLATTSAVSPAMQIGTASTADQAFNMYENGEAVQTEQALVSQNLAANAQGTQTHFTADFAADFANDPTTPAGLTPHDGFFYDLAVPPAKVVLTTPATSLAFGDQPLKTASAVKRLLFTAPADNDLAIQFGAPSLTGAAAGDFSYTTDCLTLSAGQSCHVDVTFTPQAAGARAATISFPNDSNNATSFSVNLSGNGVITATLTPARADFGDWSVGETSSATVFTWTNTTGASLTVAPSTGSTAFAIASTNCATVPAFASCTVNVVFKPTALGAANDTLTVTASYLGASLPLTAALTGNGVPALVIDPAAATFGNTDVGFASAAQVFTVRNNSVNAVAINSIAASPDFVVTSHCGVSIAAHSSCLVDVVFQPTRTGALTASLIAAPVGLPSVSAALTGNGVDFAVAISPGSKTVIAGLGVDVIATITPLGGFNGAVQLTCPPPTDGAVCTPAAQSLQLSRISPARVDVSTTSEYTVIGYHGFAGVLGVLGALLMGARMRRVRIARYWMVLALGVIAMTVSGCSGKLPSLNSPFTHPGKYAVTLQVTDGKLVRSASFDLTVIASK